jgi:plasmid stabilization system protein ParE
MKRIEWSPQALDDFDELLAYIADQNPRNAELVRDRILKSVELLAEFQFGQDGPIPNTYRHFVPKTSYFVVYRNRDSVLEIAAFCHASSDWMNMTELEK